MWEAARHRFMDALPIIFLFVFFMLTYHGAVVEAEFGTYAHRSH